VTAEIDGETLSDREIVGFAALLLLAGHITTTALLGNAIRCLDENSDAQAALRADPARIPSAVEEVLRYRSPFVRLARCTTVDVDLGGTPIPARQLVVGWLLSANHDERQFEDPDRFVIRRDPNPHVGFGPGIHFCPGAPLARLESRIAIGILLRRYADIRVDHSRPLDIYVNPGFNSTMTLRVVVQAA
jgi:cytochrome P450